MELTLYGLSAVGISYLLNDAYDFAYEFHFGKRWDAVVLLLRMAIIHAFVFCCGAAYWVFRG